MLVLLDEASSHFGQLSNSDSCTVLTLLFSVSVAVRVSPAVTRRCAIFPVTPPRGCLLPLLLLLAFSFLLGGGRK